MTKTKTAVKLSATQKKVLALIGSGHVHSTMAGADYLHAHYSSKEVDANRKRNWQEGNVKEGLWQMDRVPRGQQALRGLTKLGLVSTRASGHRWIDFVKLTKLGREVLAGLKETR